MAIALTSPPLPTSHASLMSPNETSYSDDKCNFYEWSKMPQQAGLLRIFTTISVLTVLVVVVVLGNALVIAAVLLRRRLRSATGLLILSLGVADLLVGTVILPFSIANEVLSGYWIFGKTWCTMWLTMDIWMCTASIYNLVAISIDRYIAIIKSLNYPIIVTKFRARCIVALVWILSFLICSPSFILASTHKPKTASENEECKCTPSHAGNIYIIFSASSSFYIPMIVVIFVYVRIYVAARAATKSIYSGMMQVTANANKNTKNYLMNNPSALGTHNDSVPMLRVHRGSSIAHQNGRLRTNNGCQINGKLPTYAESCNSAKLASKKASEWEKPNAEEATATAAENAAINSPTKKKRSGAPCRREGEKESCGTLLPINNWHSKSTNALGRLLRRAPKKRAGCAYEKRLSLEIKAAKTVAIVTGCFIFCWLGFAILYGFSIETNQVTWSILFWLGYLNSALNPVIYTVFNREFRICFKRLLTCHRVNNHTNANKNVTTNNSYNSTLRCGGAKSVPLPSISSPTHAEGGVGRGVAPALKVSHMSIA